MYYRKLIFISYLKEDQSLALELYYELKNEGFEPWIDKLNLRFGANWHNEIREAIQNARIFPRWHKVFIVHQIIKKTIAGYGLTTGTYFPHVSDVIY